MAFGLAFNCIIPFLSIYYLCLLHIQGHRGLMELSSGEQQPWTGVVQIWRQLHSEQTKRIIRLVIRVSHKYFKKHIVFD